MSGPGAEGTADWLARGLGSAAGAGAWTPPSAESLAETFPGLRVLELAGRGGMGAVYRAEQTRLGRTVAVKIMAPGALADPMARERFEREARVLSGLNHPHVLHVYDFGVLADGTHYLVTEWADGGDLGRLLAGRPHPLAEVNGWVAQIAAALDATHARGVVHRDLKPANVLVRADGRLALADFGVALAQGAGFTTTLTLSGTIFGTFDYMAPEQLEAAGTVTPATDIYALGVMTYQMVTGRLPKGAYARPSRAVGAPVAVDETLDAAMASESGQRPRSAGEFAQKFAVACGAKSSKARRGSLSALVVALGALALTLWWRTARVGEAAKAETNQASLPTSPSFAAPGSEPGARPEPLPPSPTAPEPETASSAAVAKSEPANVPWMWLLPEVRPAEHATNGGWTKRGSELKTDGGVCALALPVRVSPDFNYDVAVEFTRTAGRNSVGVYLPTSSGTGVFEMDAWDKGLGGIQMINGQDMRAHGEFFPAALRNGDKQQVLLEVRGARISATWNGQLRRTWNLAGRSFTNNWLWDAGSQMGLGLCSWKSPTVFHRVGYRTMPAE